MAAVRVAVRDRLRLEAMQRDLNDAARLAGYGDVTVTFGQAHAVLTAVPSSPLAVPAVLRASLLELISRMMTDDC
jgi:hypothetical protein